MNNFEKSPRDDDGPSRVHSIVSELFEFVLENKQHIDKNIAEESVVSAKETLGVICKTCREINDEGDAPEIEISQTSSPEPRSDNDKRKMHLLRLISCKLSHAFDKKHNPNPIERKFSVGIDYYLRRLFTPEVYEQLNEQAERMLMVSGVGDNVIINNVNTNIHHKNFLNNVLVRFAQSFRKFDTAHYQFMDDVNQSNPSAQPLGKNEFHLIMSSLLNDLMLTARSQRDGAMMDFLYGPRTSQVLDEISQNLSKHRMGK